MLPCSIAGIVDKPPPRANVSYSCCRQEISTNTCVRNAELLPAQKLKVFRLRADCSVRRPPRVRVESPYMGNGRRTKPRGKQNEHSGEYWCGVGRKAARRNLGNLIERDPLINQHHRDVFPHWIKNLLV